MVIFFIKKFTAPIYMIKFENSLYMTGNLNLWKLDEHLNTLIQYNATGSPSYRGLYFNSTNRMLYVAPYALTLIHVFDINLSLNHTFLISPYSPWSITGYSNQFYRNNQWNSSFGSKNHFIQISVNQTTIYN